MGDRGSFSDIAAHELADQMGWSEVCYYPLTCARNIMDRLRGEQIDYGVLAVENSSAGPVEEFTQTFGSVPYEVLAEDVLPIHHCLFKKSAAVPADRLTEVVSHQQALLQTAETRAAHYPGLQEDEIEDTALGAQWLAQGRLPDTAAVICSRRAGELWDLDLIEENIEDTEDNRTTFLLLKLA